MTKWKTYKLSDVAEIKYGKDHQQLADGNIPVYGSGGVMRYADRALYEKESILIPRKGTLSNLFYIDNPFWSVDTMFYTKIKDGTNGKYLFYLLKTMDLASMNVGSAVPSLTTEVLNKIEINLPDIKTQIEQASILTAFDDKIELNLQINQTLENMAQTIFKEWFVNFKFPGFDGNLVDGLPKKWRKSTIGSIAKNIQYGYTQSSSLEDVGPKFLRITDIQNGTVDWSLVPYCPINIKELKKYKIQPHDIFVARTGASTGENIYIIDAPAAVFASYLIRIQFERPEQAFYIGKFMRRQEYFNYISSSLGGSAQPNANAKTLTNIEVVIPTINILMDYFDIAFPLQKKIVQNRQEIETLTQIRESLLPKLMTGKIEVKV